MLAFPEKISDFHPPKFLMTFFLVIDHKFWISPILPVLVHFPPVSQKLLFPLHLLVYFVSPYFYHDAFMHHQMHVLDASGPGASLLHKNV